jgi:hypothetical protein
MEDPNAGLRRTPWPEKWEIGPRLRWDFQAVNLPGAGNGTVGLLLVGVPVQMMAAP